MYNLIEYCYNYSKTSGSLWQYYKYELDVAIVNSESFKFKTRIIGKTSADCNTTDVKIAVPLKYVRHFWRTLVMSLINCEINLFLTWSTDSFISSASGAKKFAIPDAKLYVPIVTLPTQGNANLLKQFKPDLKEQKLE